MVTAEIDFASIHVTTMNVAINDYLLQTAHDYLGSTQLLVLIAGVQVDCKVRRDEVARQLIHEMKEAQVAGCN